MVVAMKLIIHSDDTAPAGSKALLEGIQADLGLVPHLAGTVAESPTLLAAFDALRRTVAAGSLDPTCREVAGLATGVAVDNAYGVAFHSLMLAGLGVPEPDIDLMRAGTAPSSDFVHAAVYELARSLVLERGKVPDQLIERVTAAGLTSTDILEVLTECVFASLVGLVDNLAGRVELDPFLQPRSWP
jgi:alkylhydroperoxidase family enzyme